MTQSFKTAVLIYIIFRVVLSLWAIVALQINPLPDDPDSALRPYLGQPILSSGQSGVWLGPWQRFDSLRYSRIAAQGYENEEDSVFPPLYPLLSRIVGNLFGGQYTDYLLGSILVSNVATVGLLWLFIHIGTCYFSPQTATRAAVYLSLFPTSFFLFAPYSESLFILCAIGSIWQAKNGRFLLAGILGFIASLTRLTGIVLVVPLILAWWEFQDYRFWPLHTVWQDMLSMPIKKWLSGLPALLPVIGTGTFFVLRSWLSLRPLSEIYQEYWFQTTNLPGSDVWRAIQTMFFNGPSRSGEITLWIDFFTFVFLIGTTILVFKRLGLIWGTYNLLLIAFMLLPTSDLKPLYSFSRYALAFIPTFWVLAEAGERPLINRLVLYTSLPLLLYLSGQFFIWGWVA